VAQRYTATATATASTTATASDSGSGSGRVAVAWRLVAERIAEDTAGLLRARVVDEGWVAVAGLHCQKLPLPGCHTATLPDCQTAGIATLPLSLPHF
jgi:hypothetical protein